MSTGTDVPPTTEETQSRQSMMKGWIDGLTTALPNPSIGASNANPETNPEVADPAAAPGPRTSPATSSEVPSPKGDVPAKPPAEPKPADPTAPAPEGTDETKWPRSAKEWKNFTEKRKAKETEYQKQLAERETRIKELEAKTTQTLTPEIQKQIDDLKKENQTFSEQLRLTEVTRHPRFKEYFERKTNAVLAPLKSCVSADKLEPVTKLLQAPESESRNQQIELLLEDMSPLQQGRFLSVINGLSDIQTERETEIAKASQNYEQMVAQAKVEKEQRHAKFTQMLDDTVKGMQDPTKGRPEYQMREGETEWNSSVQKRLESGRQLITGNLPPEVMFKAAFDAAAYPDVLAAYKQTLSEVEALKKQIAAMTAATPKVEPRRETQTGTTPQLPKDARPMDFTKQWVDKFAQGMRGEQ